MDEWWSNNLLYVEEDEEEEDTMDAGLGGDQDMV